MKREIAELWAKALSSDDYQQGAHALRSKDDSFCCLGVLCNLHAQAHPKIAARETDPEFYLGEWDVVPEKVKKWAGLKNSEGEFQLLGNPVRVIVPKSRGKSRKFESLIDMNDVGRIPFNDIAKVILDNVEKL